MHPKQISAKIESLIAKETGAAIEWTFRTDNAFTISGALADVKAAVAFIVKAGLAKLDGEPENDEELDCAFAYLTQ